MTQLSDHFTSEEFACKCGCGFDDVSPELIHLLESIREEYGKSMWITSGCRCTTHNNTVGGVQNSAHTPRPITIVNDNGEEEEAWVSTAADIAIAGGADRRKLVDCAVMLWASGIGVARSFVHIDCDHVLPRPSLWSY